MKVFFSLTLIITLFGFSASSSELTPQSVNGTYHLSIPERGKSQVIVQFGKLGNKTVIAVAGCKNCTPAVYSYLPEESKTLGTEIFTTAGLYLIQYNADSFVLVQPDGQLGRKIWSKIGHTNIYSKSATMAKQTNTQTIQTFAIDLSKKIMNQEVGSMSHQSGEYFLAVPQQFMGKARNSVKITSNASVKKSISISPCKGCSDSIYEHLPKESAIVGVDVYRHATSYYLFDLKDGVYIYTFANASGLGRVLWSKNSNYNVYSNNKAYIRQILSSKEKQATIDSMMAGYFKDIKTEFEREAEEKRQQKVANRKLPEEKLVYDNKSTLLQSVNDWAKAWGWKETIVDAYLTQNDWSITRNRLTGVITGKIIRGITTMKHPDGRCRFQIVSFRKDYDGANYMNLHVTGIGPIYDLKCENI